MTDAQLRLDDGDVSSSANDAFQQLVREHHELDERVRQLSDLAYLTAQQQQEEVSLKKRKLALKDRIAGLARAGGTTAGSA